MRERDLAESEAQHEMLSALPQGPQEEGGPGIVANSAVNIMGRVFGNGLSALSSLITARVLGPASYGIVVVAFGLVELGRGLSNFTHNPSIIEAHRGTAPARVFGTSLALKLTGATLFFLVLLAASPWLGETFHVPPWAIVLASCVLVVGTFFEVGAARLESENRMLVSNLLLGLGPVVGLLGTLLLWWLGLLTPLASIGLTVAATATMSAAFMFAWNGPIRFHYDKRVAAYLVAYGSRLAITSFLTQALIWTDTLLVSYLLGNAATGVYQVAFNLTFVMVTLSVSIGVALVPAMSRLAGSGGNTALTYQRGTLLALVLSVGLALVYVAIGYPFLLLYGAEYVSAYPALLILTLFGVAGALGVPAASLLTVHGHANWLMVLGVAQLAINIVLNVVFIKLWGITGAAAATTLVFLFGTTVSWMLVRRALGVWPLSREAIQELRQGVLHRR